MIIRLRQNQILFGGETLKTRSNELVRFVGYLAWKFKESRVSEWVGLGKR